MAVVNDSKKSGKCPICGDTDCVCPQFEFPTGTGADPDHKLTSVNNSGQHPAAAFSVFDTSVACGGGFSINCVPVPTGILDMNQPTY